jgi:hypothetical protein
VIVEWFAPWWAMPVWGFAVYAVSRYATAYAIARCSRDDDPSEHDK